MSTVAKLICKYFKAEKILKFQCWRQQLVFTYTRTPAYSIAQDFSMSKHSKLNNFYFQMRNNNSFSSWEQRERESRSSETKWFIRVSFKIVKNVFKWSELFFWQKHVELSWVHWNVLIGIAVTLEFLQWLSLIRFECCWNIEQTEIVCVLTQIFFWIWPPNKIKTSFDSFYGFK